MAPGGSQMVFYAGDFILTGEKRRHRPKRENPNRERKRVSDSPFFPVREQPT
jgi:hypothetical protein